MIFCPFSEMIMMIIIGKVETRDLNKECFDEGRCRYTCISFYNPLFYLITNIKRCHTNDDSIDSLRKLPYKETFNNVYGI